METTIYLLEFPFPPGLNHLYAHYRGRRIKSKEGKAYDDDCKIWGLRSDAITAASTLKDRLKDPWILVRVDAWLGFNYSDLFSKEGLRKKRDSSNYIKALHDGLSLALGIDDHRFFAGLTKPALVASETRCVHLKLSLERIKAIEHEIASDSSS